MPHGRYEGVSDDAPGRPVERRLDRERGVAWLGVNLEGMAYDGWPLPGSSSENWTIQHCPTCAATARCRHDHDLVEPGRMAGGRRGCLLAEIQLGDTPTTLDKLDPDKWRTILLDAYRMSGPGQEPSRGGSAGRVAQERQGRKVGVAALHFSWVLWRSCPGRRMRRRLRCGKGASRWSDIPVRQTEARR